MPVGLQAFLLRWLPIGAIVIAELVLLVPLRREILAGTDWGPFVTLAAYGLSLILLVDLRSAPPIRLRLPDPNGRTIPAYLGQLAFFALAVAPIVFTPLRR